MRKKLLNIKPRKNLNDTLGGRAFILLLFKSKSLIFPNFSDINRFLLFINVAPHGASRLITFVNFMLFEKAGEKK